MIDPVCQPRAARYVKGEAEEGSAGESREGLADGSGARKNLIPFINQMKLFTAASHQSSKGLTDEMLRNADYVITVCDHADQHCPVLPPNVHKLYWPIPDPAITSDRPRAEALAAFRQARDELESRIRQFVLPLLK